jgi:hypothetical protein
LRPRPCRTSTTSPTHSAASSFARLYLDPDVRDYLAARAKDKGIEVNQLVNELLKRDIELIETAK